MKFRTEVDLPPSEKKIGAEDQVFSIGSCFSSEISALLSMGQIQTLCNPFGTLFNPYSINKALKKTTSSDYYVEKQLVSFGDQTMSLDHHTAFDSADAKDTLKKINTQVQTAHQFLKGSKWILITYGSSFVYEFLPQKRYVANCHKIPAKYFEKKLLSHEEIVNAMAESIGLLNDICPQEVQILMTVSPVRHTKDGMPENSLSKAKLLTAVHEVVSHFSNCTYLPVYEILLDDLRDYRFYREDLIHPNSQAINYIWEKFSERYFSAETLNFVKENFKIGQALQHKPLDISSPKYLEFVRRIEQKIQIQQSRVSHKIF